MEKKQKKPYIAPQTTTTRIEVENAVCSGSVTVQNPDNNLGQIEEQEINKDFSADFSSEQNWTADATTN